MFVSPRTFPLRLLAQTSKVHGAARRLEVDDDHVGIDRADAREKLRGFIKAHDIRVARLAQGVFQDYGPGRILVDDDDLEGGLHGRSRQFSSLMPTPRQFRIPELLQFLAAAAGAGCAASRRRGCGAILGNSAHR